LPDFDYFSGDELCKRVVAIFEGKVSKAMLIGRDNALNILRPERSILEHLVDWHRAYPGHRKGIAYPAGP
jgi:hypothetical protein